MKPLLLAITGASGMLYARSLLDHLARLEMSVHGIISDCGRQVLRLELGLEAEDLGAVEQWFSWRDFTAPPASGSCPYQAMVILPCTTGTLAAIAAGTSANLIHRAADVSLKERRPLVLAVRETPLNRIHLRNMLTVQEAGGIICPAMPSFYLKPRTLDEMAAQFAARICDQIGIDAGQERWQGV